MNKIKHIAIDITYKCNFRCLHCYNYSGEHNDRLELTDNEIIHLNEELINNETESICLCGGEPMLRQNIVYKVCKYTKGTNTKISTVSNGYLIDENVVKNFNKYGLSNIQLSLDGATASKHDWLRNKEGSFVTTIKALQLLHEYDINTSIAFCPTKRNIDELGSAIDLTYDLGVSLFRIQPAMKIGRAIKNLDDYFLDNLNYMKVKYIINQKRNEYQNKNFSIDWGDPLEHLHFSCQAKGYDLLDIAISGYGDILLSNFIPVSFGNIKKRSLNEYLNANILSLWNSPIIRNIVGRLNSVEDLSIFERLFPELDKGGTIDLDMLGNDYNEKSQLLMERLEVQGG